jgi:flagellar protein FlbB
MKLLRSGWVLALLAVLINLGITAALINAKYGGALKKGAASQGMQAPKFWSFRPEDVDDLIAELKTERAKVATRETELDIVASHIAAEKQELEKTQKDVAAIRDEISAEIPQIQESEKKNLKTLSQTYATISPAAVVAIFKEMDENMCVKILSLMKPDKVGAILQQMSMDPKDDATLKRAARLSDKLRLLNNPPKPQA